MNEFIIQWYSRSIFNFQPSEIKQLFRKIKTKSKQLITNNLHQEFNNICLNENLLPNIYICIYIKNQALNGTQNVQEQKVFCFRFYILCENFSKIGPIIKKIPKFWDDPLKSTNNTLKSSNLSHVKIRRIYALAMRLAIFLMQFYT